MDQGKIEKREITAELRESYLDYAMSVIVGRALPDVRDGLKPVHRRILWAMWDSGLTHSAKLRKSANVVGEVLGRYHPHGDMAVYDALARMAQDFSLRYPLIQGQGNWGSVDGDSPAAMRYTECRLSALAEELLVDIEKETVDFMPNYDGSREEPKVLPAKLPNLLINGSDGIAVGMATKIPPHNLSEVIDATVHLIDHPKAVSDDLMQFVQGPDFPTGGVIYNKKEIIEAYKTGRGRITIRGVAEVEEKKIIVTEIPYQVNKAELIIKIAELVTEKRIEGIRDLRDESDKDGLRIAIDLKSDAIPQKILNQLWNYTDLQKDFHLNMLALTGGLKPEIMSIKDVLTSFVAHREQVVRRRAEFDLRKARERAHILEGLVKALSIIDKIIATIKKSADKVEAHKALVKNFKLSDLQATAILEMKLQTLAALERERLEDELKEKKKLIDELTTLLKNPEKVLRVIKSELADLKSRFGDARRTKVHLTGLKDLNVEDLIPAEEAIITMSGDGYIKRLPPDTFKKQRRGGKGLIGSEVGEDDVVGHFLQANTHDNILFFTSKGRAFQTKVYEIPVGSRVSKGKAIHNFLEIPPDEEISALITYNTKKSDAAGYLVMLTEKGIIKKTSLADFGNVRRNGIIAMNLKKGDKLRWVKLSSGHDELILTTSMGQAIRFKESTIRAMGRSAQGVRGISLKRDDSVSSVNVINPEKKEKYSMLVIMANGFAKFTPLREYKIQNRGGRGILTAKITPKTGHLVSSHVILEELELLAISVKGQILRTEISSIRKTGRSAQGVRIMRLRERDKIAGTVCL
ncbi:MAG: DNA gyrase subunit A [Candidatus Colwellbacteria bacterium]|nr:DNA gyrase subunit A [Candidatus Colwellbacteria bacterium]